jgi:hypothetical protein
VSVVVSDEDPFDFVADDGKPVANEQPEEPASGAETAPPASRRVPGGPGSRTEKALGLEVARLFGLSPRLLTTLRSPAAERPAAEEAAAPDPGGEHDDDRAESDSPPQASDP